MKEVTFTDIHAARGAMHRLHLERIGMKVLTTTMGGIYPPGIEWLPEQAKIRMPDDLQQTVAAALARRPVPVKPKGRP